MHHLHSRILPRLVLDTISTLWLAHDSVAGDLQRQSREAIACLQHADTSDADRAAFMLLDLADHLRQIASKLEYVDRPLTAKRVRGVLDRVEHLSAWRSQLARH